MGMTRKQLRPAGFRLIEHGEASRDVARIEGVPQVLDKLRSDFHNSTDSQGQSNSVDMKREKREPLEEASVLSRSLTSLSHMVQGSQILMVRRSVHGPGGLVLSSESD